MKISHEIPKTLFPHNSAINDYPYLLAHLLSKDYHYDKEYAVFYKEEVKKYEYSILDNSAFELGESIEGNELKRIAQEYQVSHVVLPDIYRDADKTIELTKKFYPVLKSDNYKLFAVLQGHSVKDMMKCYDYFNTLDIDVIGINFQVLEEDNMDRNSFYEFLLKERQVTQKIHFLGVQSPYELLELKPELKKTIHSIDTSNPIICGLEKYIYSDKKDSNYVKPTTKLADVLNANINELTFGKIWANIQMFKKFCD